MSSFDKPVMICHVEKSLNHTLYDCKWIPLTAKFVVIGCQPKGTGTISLFEVESSDVKCIKQIDAAQSLKCGTFGAVPKSSHHLSTGDFKGNLQTWDIETSKNVYDIKAHDEIINCIDGIGGKCAGPPEIATGSRDGTVKIWDTRQKDKPVTAIEPLENEVKRDCWAVCFGNSFNADERVVCSGYDNGDLKLFDLRQQKLLWEKNLKNGICGLEFDRRDIEMNKLVATTLESKFHLFDCRTLHPKKGFNGLIEKAHKSTIWLGKHLPQNRDIFMTTGGNGGLSLWKYNYPEKRVKEDSDGVKLGVIGSLDLLQNVTLSTQPINSFDWCPDKIGLGIGTSFDQCVRLIIVTKLNLY